MKYLADLIGWVLLSLALGYVALGAAALAAATVLL
jgi:hypothetical protein